MNPDNGLFCDMAREKYGLDLEEVNACLGSPSKCIATMEAAGYVEIFVTEAEDAVSMYAPDLTEYADKIWRLSVGSPFAPIEAQKLLSDAQIAEFKAEFLLRVQEAAKDRWDGKFVKNPHKTFYVVGRQPAV